MNKLETREQAKQRAVELFPKVPIFSQHYVTNKTGRQAFLQCWDELSKTKELSQTCGYCVKPSKENQRKLLSEIMLEDEKDGIYEESQRMSEESEKDNQIREAEWISVKEKLPEKGVYVWCYSKSMGMVSDCYECDVFDEHWFKGDRENYLTDVTHWMPLPKPPKQ